MRLSWNNRLIPRTFLLSTLAAAMMLVAVMARAQQAQPTPTPAQTLNTGNALGGAPVSPAAAAQQMGLSPSQIANLKNEYQSGLIGPEQIQRLCARAAAANYTAAEIQALASSMGLSGTQLSQLQACITQGRAAASASGNAGPAQAPPAKLKPSAPSAIERAFRAMAAPQTRVAAPTPAALSQFGYSLFARPVTTFAPVGNVPVSDNYVIGPGDQLDVLMWGRVNTTLRLKVQRDGTILVPQIGPLQVAGLSFGAAKKLIEGRAGQITGVQVDVTMGRLRTIQVFVVGEVRQPGAYTVSSLSRISNALMAAGGIIKVGSLRDVQLRRGNQLAAVLDLYSLLLHGSARDDIRLEPQDVIFVPVIGKVAAVAGDVKRPAIYELSRGGQTLPQLIGLAGGISAFGYAHRVQVERIRNHQRRVVLDLPFDQVREQRFAIQDGDLVKVYPVLPQQLNIVTLRGNVYRPGTYQWHPGMRISDLLAESEGVAPRTYFAYALLRREEGRSRQVHYIGVDLSKALQGPASADDLELDRRDQLRVFSESEMRDLPRISVSGEVRKPGSYVLHPGMRVSDLVYLAGGLTPQAYLDEAELARTIVINGSHTGYVYSHVVLRDALGANPTDDPLLRRNDALFVRRVPNWHLPHQVLVMGEVLRPGPYAIHDGERLSSLLRRCGGFLPDAYLPAAVFTRVSVRAAEQREINSVRLRMKEEVAQLQLKPKGLGEKAGNTASEVAALESAISVAQHSQASGRVVIRLRPLGKLAGTPDDVALRDHDVLIIPKRPDSVNVLGQVYHPTALVYQPALTLRDYLAAAGGPTELANSKAIMLIKADGSVVTEQGLKNSSENSLFPLLPVISGGLMQQQLEPGDTVYVPENLEYVSNLQYATQISQVAANAAVSLGVLGILASSL